MRYKCVCAINAGLCFLVCCALEGNTLPAGQAAAIAFPAASIMLYSFMHTDWYEPVESEV